MRIKLLVLAPLLLASCATEGPVESAQGPTKKTMTEKFYGPPIKQDANGAWPADVERISDLDGKKQSPYFKGKFESKPYQTGEYAKSSWWGRKTATTQAYGGNTDASRLKTTARQQALGAPEGNTSARLPGAYQSGNYLTGGAREANGKQLGTPASNAQGRTFPEQDVISWKQRRDLDVSATKSILGND